MPAPPRTPLPPAPVYPHTIEITVGYDEYPYEISWSLKSEEFTLLAQPFSSVQTPYTVITRTITVGPGTHTFEIQDSYGDGLSIPGYVEILVDGVATFVREDYNFGFIDSFDFEVGGVTYFLLIQYDSMPGETIVQLINLETERELAYFGRDSVSTPGGFISIPISFGETDRLALVVIDSEANGMPGGYIAIDSCDTKTNEDSLLFIRGDSFEDGIVMTFSLQDMMTTPPDAVSGKDVNAGNLSAAKAISVHEKIRPFTARGKFGKRRPGKESGKSKSAKIGKSSSPPSKALNMIDEVPQEDEFVVNVCDGGIINMLPRNSYQRKPSNTRGGKGKK